MSYMQEKLTRVVRFALLVRRGADRADIYSLAFSPTAERLGVSSDRGTVHVFNLKVDSGPLQTAPDQNNGSPPLVSHLSFMKGVLPKYFSSEWSAARVHLTEGLQYVVGFGHQKNTVVILGMDGRIPYPIEHLNLFQDLQCSTGRLDDEPSK
ncbi:hypothetical protein L1987_20147 [Smallanthus sonchifolius]|uniref:Uncharacterized protein n=1 Tax=Smallanthus sonchifolius TaxID=185202 RepID=A0ACB9IT26_9ASTR|nr:hypothetical protein L1987_20147 [Smallanthus sonchifolius]